MNLRIGGKEKVGNEWIYWLIDGTRLTQAEWTGRVETHIREHNNQEVFQRFRAKLGTNRWFDEDTPHDFALQNYAAVHCTNVNIRGQEPNRNQITGIKVRTIKDEFGCDQLMLG